MSVHTSSGVRFVNRIVDEIKYIYIYIKALEFGLEVAESEEPE